MTDKERLKKKINSKVNELIDGAAQIGSINFFEINIKHIKSELMIELKNKYKDRV
ncbi:hypothetical protein [Clostridium botulinum]|nr:hypothetical protein [Clostridium botulinum]KEH96153.1 hypothetical protein Z953_p0218 [Clostridium botulinum D str. 16868]MCD3202864.1 hypothetical protein [Clostridium botulinum C/D]MCD3230849.1 hypothetical protein [Clostridium botulinum C/D]MCD3253966.1 hypothetical protein [Clostridium botulinum C/D]MCD3279438.1 hypothetical protein [Clostridium botulinum C/D]